MSEFIDSKKFKDTKKKIINSKNKLEESFENVEKKSMNFYTSVKSLYLQEKNQINPLKWLNVPFFFYL